jgi:hypothetical protein
MAEVPKVKVTNVTHCNTRKTKKTQQQSGLLCCCKITNAGSDLDSGLGTLEL